MVSNLIEEFLHKRALVYKGCSDRIYLSLVWFKTLYCLDENNEVIPKEFPEKFLSALEEYPRHNLIFILKGTIENCKLDWIEIKKLSLNDILSYKWDLVRYGYVKSFETNTNYDLPEPVDKKKLTKEEKLKRYTKTQATPEVFFDLKIILNK
jgi:hypothetical protein